MVVFGKKPEKNKTEKNNFEKTFLNVFFSNYYYLNILIIKQDKNLPYSLKIIYLNLYYRIFYVFKLFFTRFFSFLFHYNSKMFNTNAFFNLKTKLIKNYKLNNQKQISSTIQNPIKKNRTFNIKKYLNQGLWQLNKKEHNQNPLKWVFSKYWSNIYCYLILSKNLTVYYSFKSDNIKLSKFFFNKMVLTKKIDPNLIRKPLLFQSNILKNFKIGYKLNIYPSKIFLKKFLFLNLNQQKKFINVIQLDSYILLLDHKIVKLSYFFNIKFVNLFKYKNPISFYFFSERTNWKSNAFPARKAKSFSWQRQDKIKYQPIILFLNKKII